MFLEYSEVLFLDNCQVCTTTVFGSLNEHLYVKINHFSGSIKISIFLQLQFIYELKHSKLERKIHDCNAYLSFHHKFQQTLHIG